MVKINIFINKCEVKNNYFSNNLNSISSYDSDFLDSLSILSLTLLLILIVVYPSSLFLFLLAIFYIIYKCYKNYIRISRFNLLFVYIIVITFIIFIDHLRVVIVNNHRTVKKMSYKLTLGIVGGAFLTALLMIQIRRHYKKILKRVEEELREVRHRLRSALTRFGTTFEKFIPFIKNYPGEREHTFFLGMPIDYISFDSDYIRFIEVKTGHSQLNQNQKRIKELIDDKKVKFIELRY